MRYTKRFAGLALAAGMLLGGGVTLRAADWDPAYRRQELRSDYSELREDRRQMERLSREIAHDRRRLHPQGVADAVGGSLSAE